MTNMKYLITVELSSDNQHIIFRHTEGGHYNPVAKVPISNMLSLDQDKMFRFLGERIVLFSPEIRKVLNLPEEDSEIQTKTFSETIDEYLPTAKANDIESQFILYGQYYGKAHEDQKWEYILESEKWLKLAAEGGLPSAVDIYNNDWQAMKDRARQKFGPKPHLIP